MEDVLLLRSTTMTEIATGNSAAAHMREQTRDNKRAKQK